MTDADVDPARASHGRPRLTVVVPMFREAPRIARTVELLAASELRAEDVELIFVDDGSDDATVDVLKNALAEATLAATVLQLPENRGKGAAVRVGMLAAAGAVVAFSDADLSSDAGEVLRVAALVERGDCDVAVASRGLRESTITERQPWFRQMSGRTFNRILHVLGLTAMTDTQCGLKAFRHEVVADAFAPLRSEGFAFDVEVLARAQRAGWRIREEPVSWHHVEESRVRPFRHGCAMLLDAVRIRFWLWLPTARRRRRI